MRKHIVVAGALGAVLGLVNPGQAQQAPPPASKAPDAPPSFNQRMANAIVGHIRARGAFKNYNVDVAFNDGVVDLTGRVNDPYQHAEIVRIVSSVPGVMAVRDGILVPGMTPPPAPPVTAALPTPGMPVPGMPAPGVPGAASGVVTAQAVGKDEGKLPEPLSIMPMPVMPNPSYNPPPMPPYAWPTYAPYNNLSRVAYPELYPYEAWPFIGPMYPFPKVPPGWRAVTLRWQDGHWWYGRKATGHDWWRVRYW